MVIFTAAYFSPSRNSYAHTSSPSHLPPLIPIKLPMQNKHIGWFFFFFHTVVYTTLNLMQTNFQINKNSNRAAYTTTAR